MKHALIIAHPKRSSFTVAAAQTYRTACEGLGHTTVTRDLYQIGFDPRLKAEEIPGADGFEPAPDVRIERAFLGDCDVFAFFYPLWLNAPPAMVKGYMERVFGFGFAYGGDGHSYNPLLSGRRIISFTSSGAPLGWIEQIGSLDALCVLFDDYFAKLCGMTSLDHVHVGGMRTGASNTFVHARLSEVQRTVIQHFGPEGNILPYRARKQEMPE